MVGRRTHTHLHSSKTQSTVCWWCYRESYNLMDCFFTVATLLRVLATFLSLVYSPKQLCWTLCWALSTWAHMDHNQKAQRASVSSVTSWWACGWWHQDIPMSETLLLVIRGKHDHSINLFYIMFGRHNQAGVMWIRVWLLSSSLNHFILHVKLIRLSQC